MERRRFLLSIAIVVFISCVSLTRSEPNELPSSGRQLFEPPIFIDFGGWLPAPGVDPSLSSVLTEPNESSVSEEALFATYSFSDAGTTYNVEFYYRELYHRLRARVLIGDRELRGLFNRFYDVDPTRRSMLSVMRGNDGSPVLSFNFGGFSLKESSLNTDAIYGALEDFIAKSSPQTRYIGIHVYRPPGLLKRTCKARIFARTYPPDYLVNEEGQIDQLTLENLRVAYYREGIRALNTQDFERIGWSLVVTEDPRPQQLKVISDVNDIPEYRSHPLDSDSEGEIRAPWFYKDAESQTEYWICYTYNQLGGIVARYKFGFQKGYLTVADKLILGRDIGRALYLSGYRPLDMRPLPARPQGTIGLNWSWLLSALSVMFIAVGIFLLILAYLVRRHYRSSSSC